MGTWRGTGELLAARFCQGNRRSPKKSLSMWRCVWKATARCSSALCLAGKASQHLPLPCPHVQGTKVMLCPAQGCGGSRKPEDNKQPTVSEAVLPNLRPLPAKGGGGRNRGCSAVIAASITVYQWLRSRRYRAAFAELVSAVSPPLVHHPAWGGHHSEGGELSDDLGAAGSGPELCIPPRHSSREVTRVTCPDRAQVASSHGAFSREVYSSCCQLCSPPGQLRLQQHHSSSSWLFFPAIVPPHVFQHLFCLCSHLPFARTIQVALVYLFSLMASGYKWLNS